MAHVPRSGGANLQSIRGTPQYVLAEATTHIRNRLVHDGWSAIEDETTRLNDPKTGLEIELRRIHAQEAIDAIDHQFRCRRTVLRSIA